MKFHWLAAAAAVGMSSVLLSGCGGGGSDTPTVTPVSSFPLQAGYKARISGGAADNYAISGSCAGTGSTSASAASAATFEGVAGYAAGTTATLNLTNCTPATNALTGTTYFDANYTILGSSIPSVEYAKFLTVPSPLPASVKVGDTAVYGTLTVYADSTKATVVGHRDLSYAIEADTATTVIVNLITKAYNTANQPLFTQQSRFRMAADGTLTSVTIDVQYSTTSTLHLVWTKT